MQIIPHLAIQTKDKLYHIVHSFLMIVIFTWLRETIAKILGMHTMDLLL
jgi:hypothetical protein